MHFDFNVCSDRTCKRDLFTSKSSQNFSNFELSSGWDFLYFFTFNDMFESLKFVWILYDIICMTKADIRPRMLLTEQVFAYLQSKQFTFMLNRTLEKAGYCNIVTSHLACQSSMWPCNIVHSDSEKELQLDTERRQM